MNQQHAPHRFDERWRLSRAGIVNVWYYLDNEFDLSGGRMILMRSGAIILEGDARTVASGHALKKAYFGYEES